VNNRVLDTSLLTCLFAHALCAVLWITLSPSVESIPTAESSAPKSIISQYFIGCT
jgi:hypothetical protein